MIKVLGLALYGPLAASHRYRLGQYVTGLAEAGIDLKIFHLLGDDYLRAKFNNVNLPFLSMLSSGISRLHQLWLQNEYDIIILQYELFPFIPGWLERALIKSPYIYDFDDAFYLKYSSGKNTLINTLLGAKFDTVIAGASAVTAGNHVLTEYSKRLNESVFYLPTVVDSDRYLPNVNRRGTCIFTVGWIGSPSTAVYLSKLIQPLSRLGLEGSVRLIVIGGKAPVIPNIIVDEIIWDELTEIEFINSFDVGVMPLPDDDWARGKCAFKLIQYMACALPVIASPVGANISVVGNECGFLPTSNEDWLEAFRIVRDQKVSRTRMGEMGRTRVQQHYSLHQKLPVLTGVIREVAQKKNKDKL